MTIKTSDFREKIELLKYVNSIDSELNRIENLKSIKSVWANIQAESSNIDDTEAGHKDLLKYKIFIRKQAVNFDYVRYRGKLLILTGPYYEVENKYICLKCEEIV